MRGEFPGEEGVSPPSKESGLGAFLARPQAVLIFSFAAVILLGGALLSMPFCQVHPVAFLDGLFTSVSAVCVTGLVTKDTGGDFSLAGQWVILGLIQVGGLGIMTFSAFLGSLLGRRLSLRNHYVLQDVFLPEQSSGKFGKILVFIVVLTAVVEVLGALLLWIRLGANQAALFPALFHSVSAFCNAGFSLWSDSLVRFRGDPVVNLVIMGLVVTGGLGHIVLFEVTRRIFHHRKKDLPVLFSLHTRLVFWTTLFLVVLGAVLFFLFESGNSLAGLPPGEKVLASLFQSVTPRTAGFNTLDIGTLTTPALLLLVCLMLVGGSPGSTAGGMKTTTFVVFFASLRSWLRGEENVTIFKREIPLEAGKRSVIIASSVLLFLAAGTFVLSLTEGKAVPFHEQGSFLTAYFFEAASALGTVGLSTGVTPTLSALGKATLMVLMFAGRLGPLTLATFARGPEKGPKVGYPEEQVMLG